MKTKVSTHEGVDIFRINVRGQEFYKSDLVFGEAITELRLDEVRKKITAKLAAGDTRQKVLTHEGVNIYQVRVAGRMYFLSDPVRDETITADTIDDVVHKITVRHAIMGGY